MKSYLTRDKILLTLRATTSIGIIVFLLLYVDVEKIFKTLSSANMNLILIVFLLSFLNLFLQFTKWKLVLHHQLNENNSSKILKSLFYGIGAGMFTPLKVGEYVARAIPFKDKKISDVAIATVTDKIFNMLLVAIIGGLLFIYFVYTNLVESGKVSFEIFLVLLAGILLVVIMFTVVAFNRNSISTFLAKSKLLSSFIEKLSVLKLIKGKYLVKLLSLSVLFHLTFTIQFAILIGSFSPDFHFEQFFIIANLVIFFQLLIPPIFLGELGIREGAAVFFMQSYGYESSAGFNAALCLFVINFVLPSIYSLFITSALKK